MMTDFLTYDLKVAVLICVFYMFYRLLLARETFHHVNRVVLILTAVASFVLPLCVITMHKTVTMAAMPEVSIGDVGMLAVTEAEPAMLHWQLMLPILYIIGMAVTLGHTFLSVMKVVTLIRRSERHPQPDGTILCVTGNTKVAPFSWMRYIVMNRGDYEAQDAAILAHERGHIRLRHSWDVLLVDLLTALQWFNPAMWMLRQDLRSIHEYEADGEVLSQGINARQYQYLLISKATGIGGYSIANGINHSALKKRIHMMTNMKSKSSHLLKLLALVPIVGAAIALNARTVTDYVYEEPQTQHPVKKGKQTGTINMGATTIKVVEQTIEQPTSTDKSIPAKVSGIVKDTQTGEPIVGAILTIVGSTKGTVTDTEGKFTLDAKVGDEVVVGYVGMESRIFKVDREEIEWMYVNLQKEGLDDSEKTYDVAEKMPEFPGGVSAMMQFLSQNIHYPKEAFANKVQGRVIVQFVVGKDGNISGGTIVRSIDPQLDEEALRVIYAMPAWTPGQSNGEPVAVKFTLPITFRLQGGQAPATSADETEEAGKTVSSFSYQVKTDGETTMSVVGTGNFAIEIDGVKSDKPMSEVIKELNPSDIESMAINKDNPEKPVIIITTKKNTKE